MQESVDRAKLVHKGIPVVDDATIDWLEKASALYKLLMPKLNLELSTEFRNASAENGFELWMEVDQPEGGPSSRRPRLPPDQRHPTACAHILRGFRSDLPIRNPFGNS